jgi:hypothetical protein
MSETLCESLLARLPNKPFCARDPKRGMQIRPKATALAYPHLQLNTPWSTAFLVFDVDREGAAFAWEEELPPPSYTMVNPATAHAHLVYELKTPVLAGANSSPKPREWLGDIRRLFSYALNADLDYHGPLAMNPASEQWRRIPTGKVYDLAELSSYARLIRNRLSPKESSAIFYRPNYTQEHVKSRNCRLFNLVRRHSYCCVSQYCDQESFRTHLHEFASEKELRHLSPQSAPLPRSEIRSIVKSIARWTYARRAEFARRRLREPVLSPQDLLERQRDAALRTNALRSEKTRSRVEKTLETLPQPVGQKALARASGVSLSHIKRHWEHYRDWGVSRCDNQDKSAPAPPARARRRARPSFVLFVKKRALSCSLRIGLVSLRTHRIRLKRGGCRPRSP